MNALQKGDSVVSSPSTPNSSLSSQSNLISTPSPNTPSPATPTQQHPGLPLGIAQPTTTGSSGHKNSLKGTKLARRARSFKDDLFEKISMIRTPTNTLGRSHSPHSPRSKNMLSKPPPTAEEVARSAQSLETHVKDISNALKHFRDVILKKKLEVLPGNGTVILETIASMFAVIQTYTLNEKSTIILSATQQVYQSLGKLIKLCDEVMLSEENNECASLSNDNVKEVVDLLEKAVKNLVALAQQKLKEKEENTFKYGPAASDIVAISSSNHLMRPPVEVAGQRTSLPDITLTPKERDILEKTKSNPIRASHSTESILRDTSPPPKPPLPNRSNNPPPLPPKRRSQQQQQNNQHSNNISINSDLDCSSEFSLMNYGVDHLSVRSRSPDENSSQCSLDSALNHSREEEELKLSGLECRLDENLLEDDVEKMLAFTAQASQGKAELNSYRNSLGVGGVAVNKANMVMSIGGAGGGGSYSGVANANPLAASVAAGIQTVAAATVMAAVNAGINSVSVSSSSAASGSQTEIRKAATNNRHSNESGFVSLKSFRTSTQSVSKRSSDYSFQSSIKSSNSEIAFGANEMSSCNNSEAYLMQQQQQQQKQLQQVTTATTTSSHSTTSMSTTSNKIISNNISSNNATTATATSTTTTSISTEHHSAKIYASNSTTIKSSSSAATTTTAGSIPFVSIGGAMGIGAVYAAALNDDNHSISNTSSASPDNFERERLMSSQMQSLSSLTKTNSLDMSSADDLATISTSYSEAAGSATSSTAPPPALPPKMLRQQKERQMSHYDNFVDDVDYPNSSQEFPELRNHPNHHNQLQQQRQHYVYQWQSKHQSLIEPRRFGGSVATGIDGGANVEEPPPLPMKKKHILAYMEICSASTRSMEQHRHTMHAYNATTSRNITHSQTMNIVPLSKEFASPEHEVPPALPPKINKQRKPTAMPPTIITTPPPSPKPTHLTPEANSNRHTRVLSGAQGNEMMSTVCEEILDLTEEDQANLHHSHMLPDVDSETATTNFKDHMGSYDGGGGGGGGRGHGGGDGAGAGSETCITDTTNEEDEGIDVVLDNNNYENNNKKTTTTNSLPNMLELLDITPYLILKKEGEDGPDVKGGYIDALIVHASRVQKVTDNAFSEAFITTFRTFIQPIDVIEKLTHRYTVFFCQLNDQKQKAAKETFSLLVRVVNDLTWADLTSQLFGLLVEFVYQLVCSGQLYQVKLLRNKIIEKVNIYKDQRLPNIEPDMYYTVTNQPSLLDLKSLEIAEQMTLLDAELFQKIEIPEVLLFAKEQCEEKSPNLNKFTEHFNKMSYWARSKILMLSDAKEREKHVIKFIKIMKHLRKMNNYNSYLALLSALDSAPVRRLEWHKTITEGLKEYCTLIDSSSSFRVYRQALAETNPPCIPYIGLVLQDLTFVHVGNPDYLKEGVINFSKRWQQHNIIVNMKRFKKCAYPFKRNERIIAFFENFENFLGEEEMWQISESIKPRGKRPAHN